jgi:hypothetical protein
MKKSRAVWIGNFPASFSLSLSLRQIAQLFDSPSVLRLLSFACNGKLRSFVFFIWFFLFLSSLSFGHLYAPVADVLPYFFIHFFLVWSAIRFSPILVFFKARVSFFRLFAWSFRHQLLSSSSLLLHVWISFRLCLCV